MAQRTMFDSVIEYGTATLRALILLNGGGAIALLAFSGHLFTEGTAGLVALASNVSLAVVALGVGAALGGIATAGAYLTQFNYDLAGEYESRRESQDYNGAQWATYESMRQHHFELGVRYHRVVVAVAVGSLAVFVLAVSFAGYSAWDAGASLQAHLTPACFKIGCR